MIIYKFPLPLSHDAQEIMLPVGCKPLTVQPQGNMNVLWVLLDEKIPELRAHVFRVYGTGWNINVDIEQWTYISTTFMYGYVWHWFYKVL